MDLSFGPKRATARDPEAEVMAEEARRLIRMAKFEALKRRIGDGEVISYAELLRACEEVGTARTRAEATTLVAALDEAGFVLLFRDKVYLQPGKPEESTIIEMQEPVSLTFALSVEEWDGLGASQLA